MDEKRFTDLILEREQKLYRVSRTLLSCAADCEDAIQETLIRAWRHADGLREERYFDTWLIRILINECRRVARHGRTTDLRVPEDPPAPNPTLRRALDALSEKYRLAIVMHYLEGYSVAELAKILGVPAGTIKWRLHTGRKLLKDALTKEEAQ